MDLFSSNTRFLIRWLDKPYTSGERDTLVRQAKELKEMKRSLYQDPVWFVCHQVYLRYISSTVPFIIYISSLQEVRRRKKTKTRQDHSIIQLCRSSRSNELSFQHPAKKNTQCSFFRARCNHLCQWIQRTWRRSVKSLFARQ